VERKRVLVVGATSDYVDLIRRRHPERVVFVTDAAERARSCDPRPDEIEESLCNLASPEDVEKAVRCHLARWSICAVGIACFDCESMPAAAHLAACLGLSYPSLKAVLTCRDKFACKVAWRAAGVPCPDAALARVAEDVVEFQRRVGGDIVVKPIGGSGSEWVFRCSDAEACRSAYACVQAASAGCGPKPGPNTPIVVEEFVDGDEYSCDFVVDGDQVMILRTAAKIAAHELGFGTALAYRVPGTLPSALSVASLTRQLLAASRALGLGRAVCMVDFIARGHEALLLELTPRPGGDCLPPLLLRSAGLDTIGAALDVAEGLPVCAVPASRFRQLVGLRWLASEAGVLGRLDTSRLLQIPCVEECYVKHRPGHCVTLPPMDYDSRILGHVIFRPSAGADIDSQCRQLVVMMDEEVKRALCTMASKS